MDLEAFRQAYPALTDLREATEFLLAFSEDAMQDCPDDLAPLVEAARLSCRSAGLVGLAALCDRLLGWFDVDRSDYPSALIRFERAQGDFLALGDEAGRLKALNGIASVHSAQGRFEAAISIYREALALAEQSGDRHQAVLLTANLGSSLNDLGQHAEAEPYLHQAAFSGLLSRLNEALILTELAKSCRKQGKRDEAQTLLIRSVTASREGHFQSTLAIALGLLGELMVEAGEAGATSLLEEARLVALAAGDRAAETMATLALGRNELTARPLIALGLFELSLATSLEIGARHLEIEAYEGLAAANKALGRWKKAFSAYEAFHALSKLLRDDNVLKQLDHLKADQARKETELYQEQLRVMGLLGEIGQKISATLDLESILHIVDESIGSLMSADVFGMGLYDEASDTIDYQLFREAGRPVKPFRSPVNGDSFSSWCIRHREDILMGDMEKEHGRYTKVLTFPIATAEATGKLTRSGLFLPLIAEGRVVGVLSAQSYQLNAYTERELAALKTLAASIAIAIENARLFKQVNQLATVDSLTGASTRRYLFSRTEQEFQGYLRQQQPLALVMIDLDHFKSLNDTWGHAVGDQVLAAFGALVMTSKRPHDIFGRYGGEEFALVQTGTTLEGARKSAERLCRQVRQMPLEPAKGQALKVTASFGVTAFHPDDADVTLVFSRADEALYEAKQTGRNRVAVRP
ncbi:MAG: diguanylate cyclase [Spirochaetales bacterium]